MWTNRGPAGFCYVPRRARLGMVGVGHVGSGLIADTDSVYYDEGGVHEGGDQRVEEVGYEHNSFD